LHLLVILPAHRTQHTRDGKYLGQIHTLAVRHIDVRATTNARDAVQGVKHRLFTKPDEPHFEYAAILTVNAKVANFLGETIPVLEKHRWADDAQHGRYVLFRDLELRYVRFVAH